MSTRTPAPKKVKPSPQKEDDFLYRWYGAHVSGATTTFRVHAPAASGIRLDLEDSAHEAHGLSFVPLDEGDWGLQCPVDMSGQAYRFVVSNTSDAQGENYHMARLDPFAREVLKREDAGGARHFYGVVQAEALESPTKAQERRPVGQAVEDKALATADPKAMSIYELHPGTFWGGSYADIGDKICDHVGEHLGFTHVQMMPPFQTPIEESWGYLIGAPYALQHERGGPKAFKAMVEKCHDMGLAVIIDIPLGFGVQDWDCGLAHYDGTDLFHFEGERGWNQQWKTRVYNTTSPFVRNYLIGLLNYVHHELGIDGVRLDSISSQIFFDYDRGDWNWPRNNRDHMSQDQWNLFNGLGGDTHIDGYGYWLSEATDFDGLNFYRELHRRLASSSPSFFTIAEESRRIFKNLATPVEHGGLGFHFAQNMGEMHRVRQYLSYDVEQRDIQEIESILLEPTPECFVNAMNTHDECANGKTRLITELGNHVQMIGLAAMCWLRPGVPMIFMGDEFCEEGWFGHDRPLDWGKTGPTAQLHQQQMMNNFRDLNRLIQTEPALAHHSSSSLERRGSHNERKYFSFVRWGNMEDRGDHSDNLIFVRCESPHGSMGASVDIHVPAAGRYRVIYNSIDERYIGQQGYNNHDPYWEIDGWDYVLWIELHPFQNLVLKLCS